MRNCLLSLSLSLLKSSEVSLGLIGGTLRNVVANETYTLYILSGQWFTGGGEWYPLCSKARWNSCIRNGLENETDGDE